MPGFCYVSFTFLRLVVCNANLGAAHLLRYFFVMKRLAVRIKKPAEQRASLSHECLTLFQSLRNAITDVLIDLAPIVQRA